MSDWSIIPTQALVEAENLCNEIFNAESVIDTHEKVDEINCPICNNLPEKYRNGIDHLYGKLTKDEFELAHIDFKALQNEYTLKVYHEVAISDTIENSLELSVFAICENCKSEWNFKTNISPIKKGTK
jgi:hypothetical protein